MVTPAPSSPTTPLWNPLPSLAAMQPYWLPTGCTLRQRLPTPPSSCNGRFSTPPVHISLSSDGMLVAGSTSPECPLLLINQIIDSRNFTVLRQFTFTG